MLTATQLSNFAKSWCNLGDTLSIFKKDKALALYSYTENTGSGTVDPLIRCNIGSPVVYASTDYLYASIFIMV